MTASTTITLDHVRRALALTGFDHVSAWRRMVPRDRRLERLPSQPGRVRLAGVLILLYPYAGSLAFALTRRTESVATHKGQISLPGGAQEPGETPGQAALRETCEEIGVCLDESCLVGALTHMYLGVSDFDLYPFVGIVAQRPDFRPNPAEVAGMLEFPLPLLVDDSIKETERWNLRGVELDVPFYRLDGQIVWGATAAILSEFEGRLRTILAGGAA
jgi:8-oxo-dGTP pyrophosphatase MutT (NUDIX family)